MKGWRKKTSPKFFYGFLGRGNCTSFRSRTADAQWSLISSKSQTFGLGQTIWAYRFWGIWNIFSWFINTHFGKILRLTSSALGSDDLTLDQSATSIQKFCRSTLVSGHIFDKITTLHWVPCPSFPLINHYFYKNPSLCIPIPNVVIFIWVAKN